jgi:transcriptional regulator with XRE-family HTH domain
MPVKKASQQPPENESPLRKLREGANLTQEQLSVRLKVSTSTLRRWENGDVEPAMTREQWQEFCEAVGIPFDKLPDKLNLRSI